MSEPTPAETMRRLPEAVNAHDLETMVALFADDYHNETPAHPQRGFRGNTQVRRNWTQLFAGVPDLYARLPRVVVDGDRIWTEWDISGTRTDGAPFGMCGVVIFGVTDGRIASARFYLEPVEETSGDVDAHTARVAGRPRPRQDPVRGGDRHARHRGGPPARRPGRARSGAHPRPGPGGAPARNGRDPRRRPAG